MSKLVRRKKEIGAAMIVALQLLTVTLVGLMLPYSGGPQQPVKAPADSQMSAAPQAQTAAVAQVIDRSAVRASAVRAVKLYEPLASQVFNLATSRAESARQSAQQSMQQSMQQGEAPNEGPTLTTDLEDYPPFSYVYFTGTGFQPGETVNMIVVELDPVQQSFEPWDVVADENGNFQTSWYIFSEEFVGATLQATATGQTSGLTASATFTDAGSLTYAPTTQSLGATVGGAAVSFTQSITSPSVGGGNPAFTTSLDVAGTGANPIPASWVSTFPTTLSFAATPPSQTLPWSVIFTVPANAACGIYTAQIKADPSITGVGGGSGTAVTLTVTGCASPTPTPTPTADCTSLTASSSNTAILCNGGSSTVTVSASGGTSPYTGTGTFSHAAGPYSYTVTDANGCTATTTGNISQPTQLSASETHNPILCYGGTTTVNITASGGTPPYSGDGAQSGVSAGPFSFTVTDANGCSTVVSGNIGQPTQLVATSSVACNGGSAVVTVSASGGTPGYTGTGTFSHPSGTYSYTVTDANGCTATTTGTVAPPNTWTISGFYQPVDMGGPSVVNTVKGGSTVPLKFNIVGCDGVERTSVTDVVGSSVQVYTNNCTGGVETPLEEVANSGATNLRYDTTGHQFIQNWQTPKGANKCYRVRMTTTDGEYIEAYFKTK